MKIEYIDGKVILTSAKNILSLELEDDEIIQFIKLVGIDKIKEIIKNV